MGCYLSIYCAWWSSACISIRFMDHHSLSCFSCRWGVFCCCVSFDSEFVPCSDETRQALLEWNRHDDEAERFCMHDGNLAEQTHLGCQMLPAGCTSNVHCRDLFICRSDHLFRKPVVFYLNRCVPGYIIYIIHFVFFFCFRVCAKALFHVLPERLY